MFMLTKKNHCKHWTDLHDNKDGWKKIKKIKKQIYC